METSKPDYISVKQKVQEVLEENSIKYNDKDLPISPADIADNYGIKIEYVIFGNEHKNVAGFFDFGENKIYVNGEDPYNRRTFTIAHELGHYFLHQEYFLKNPGAYKVLFRKPIGAEHDPREKEANAFAANLLVPKNFLDKYAVYGSIEMLSKLFAVSQDVIRNRLKFEYGK